MHSASSSHSKSLSHGLRLPGFGLHSLAKLAGLYRQRQALKGLDAHLLRDIGITDAQAKEEATRPLWDVPKGWRL